MAASASLERPTDTALVDGVASGDQVAFSAIYDRYADELFDLCCWILRDSDAAAVAVRDTFSAIPARLAELTEPERLGAWLQVIAGSESLRRASSRGWPPPDPELTQPAGEQHAATTPEQRARQELAHEAAGTLSERERAVLSLHLRQRVGDEEIAAVLGLRPGRVPRILERLRDEVESSIGALLVARLARGRCAEFDGMLANWDGTFTATLGKRLGRHADGCPACGDSRRSTPDPLTLLTGMPQMRAPASLRTVVVRSMQPTSHPRPEPPVKPAAEPMSTSPSAPVPATQAVPRVPPQPPLSPLLQPLVRPQLRPQARPRSRPRSRPPADRRGRAVRRLAAVLIVLALGSAGLVIWRGPELSLRTTGQLVGHSGSEQAQPEAEGHPAAPAPAAPAPVTPGAPASASSIGPSGGAASAAPTPSQAAPPSVVRQSATPAQIQVAGCATDQATVRVAVDAGAGIKAVNLGWRPPGSGVKQVAMTRSGDGWTAALGSFATPGVVIWAVEVVDSLGRAGYGPIANLPVQPC